MLERASKVNLKLLEPIKMKRLIVQIYEVQDPIEAQALVELGVDQIGNVTQGILRVGPYGVDSCTRTILWMKAAPRFDLKKTCRRLNSLSMPYAR